MSRAFFEANLKNNGQNVMANQPGAAPWQKNPVPPKVDMVSGAAPKPPATSAAKQQQQSINIDTSGIANGMNNLASAWNAANSMSAASAEKAMQAEKEMAQAQMDFQREIWGQAKDYNSQEAQKNRDWQTEMANTAWQRGVKDMQAAGINPAAAYANAAAGTGQGAQASIGTLHGAKGSGHSYQAQMPAAKIQEWQFVANSAAHFAQGLVGMSQGKGILGKIGKTMGKVLHWVNN